MDTETTAQTQETRYEPCICGAIVTHLLTAFGLKSEAARQHVLNARIEMLKAMRTVIDERINRLAHVEEKGAKIPVE